MKNKILIGNISTGANEEKIRELFSTTAGSVLSVTIPQDERTGQNRGYAFVEMSTDLDAEQAVKELNGSDVDGRSMAMSVVEKLQGKRKWYMFGAK
jgi:RNA recognition motif-containing protein